MPLSESYQHSSVFHGQPLKFCTLCILHMEEIVERTICWFISSIFCLSLLFQDSFEVKELSAR